MSSKDRHRGPSRTSPYPLSRLSAPVGLVDTAREIEQAHTMLGAVVGAKLETIARQIRKLQQQAEQVLREAQSDLELHHAQCAFEKRPGKIYHLYRQADRACYLSMLAPEDWEGAPPHSFVGSFRLEADMSWTPAEAIPTRQERADLVRGLIESAHD